MSKINPPFTNNTFLAFHFIGVKGSTKKYVAFFSFLSKQKQNGEHKQFCVEFSFNNHFTIQIVEQIFKCSFQ